MFKNLKSFFSLLNKKQYPSWRQWQRFFEVLNKKEKTLFFTFLVTFLVSFFCLSFNFYIQNTEIKPAQGGIFVEGVVGQPRFINPIYSQLSDVDRDLTELIFSGLMKYNKEGKIVLDLAKEYRILDGGKIYEVELKENVFWSDGSPFTADDVVFTIKTIQNSDYKSPQIAAWLGVEVEKVSDLMVRFKLKNSYFPFLENLTQKIISEKLWKDISPEKFPFSFYNLNPVGTGPYKLKNLKQDKNGRIISLKLEKNPTYFGNPPYISQINFLFFNEEAELIKSFKKGKIQSFSFKNLIHLSQLPDSARVYSFSLPRYFALFFNPKKSKILADQNVRIALNYATDKNRIIEKFLFGHGRVVQSPVLPEIYGFSNPSRVYQFNLDLAREFLEKAGFVERKDGILMKTIEKKPSFNFKEDLKEGSKGKEVEELQKCLAKDPNVYPEAEISGFFGKATKEAVERFQEKYKKEILEPFGFKMATGLVGPGTRKKLNEMCFPTVKEVLSLKLSLTTVDQPTLIEIAEFLKKQWKDLGVEMEIKTFDISQLEREIIKQRDYEILLFGEVLRMIPDPLVFWHSSQTTDPGLNLAFYQNKKADKLLEESRQNLEEEERRKKLEKFQDLVVEDAPVIFLYNPNYLYFVSKEIKGLKTGILPEPSKRFIDIENWYIKTKRVWK